MYNVVTVTILQNVTLHESELAEKCDFRLYGTAVTLNRKSWRLLTAAFKTSNMKGTRSVTWSWA